MRALVEIQETVSYNVWVEVPNGSSDDDIEYAAGEMLTDLTDISSQSVQTEGLGLSVVQVLEYADEPWCNHDAVAVVNGVCECGELVGTLSKHEKEELMALNGFMELLGASEMSETQFARWRELNQKLKNDRSSSK